MRLLHRVATIARTVARSRRHRADLPRWLVRRPQLLLGTIAYEIATLASNRVQPRLKTLAELKAAALVTCEYCLDLGSAMALVDGVTEVQLRELSRYAESVAFDHDERLVLRLAEAMTATPAVVSDELRAELLARFTRSQVAELAAVIAWENQRGRLNQALGVRPTGISERAVCAVPERVDAAATLPRSGV